MQGPAPFMASLDAMLLLLGAGNLLVLICCRIVLFADTLVIPTDSCKTRRLRRGSIYGWSAHKGRREGSMLTLRTHTPTMSQFLDDMYPIDDPRLKEWLESLHRPPSGNELKVPRIHVLWFLGQ